MNVVLYSTGCPKCRVLESKLEDADIDYTVVDDIKEIEKLGILSVPILQVDGKIMQFKEANDWLNEEV